jgi:hypothetical protein
MSANATIVFDYIVAQLAVAKSGFHIYKAKRPVAAKRPPDGGWNPGWSANPGAFVVSMLEAEPVDDDGDFEEVSVGYTTLVEICLPSMAATAGGTSPTYDEDTLFRDIRQAVRNILNTPRVPGLDVANVTWKSRPVYEFSGAGGAPVLVSGQAATYEVFEPRPA